MADKFEKFTERARKVLTYAQEEAMRLNHNYIGTEHLLLGLIREGDGVAARALSNEGVDLAKARSAVEYITGRGDSMIIGELGITPRAKKVIELAARDAQKLHHHYIGTEHLLLGLLDEGAGIGVGVLRGLDVDLERVRRQILQIITSGGATVTAGREAREKFEKFTERARKVLTLAQEEAQRFNHNYIGTEHLLLGLIKEGDGVAARILSNMGVRLEKVRAAVEEIIGRGDSMIVGEMGLTPRAKKVIELAVEEARRLNHHFIGTEHLLLGLIREGEGIGAGVLESLGVSLPEARRQVTQVVSKASSITADPAPSQPEPRAPRRGPIGSPGPPLGDLLRVIPIAQAQAADGVDVTLLSLESYAHGFIIHYRAILGDKATLHPGPPIYRAVQWLDVSDDRDGHYDGQTQFGTYDAHAWYVGALYQPAIDPEARELLVHIPAGGAPPTPPESAGEEQPAPAQPYLFTFTIPLHPEGR